MKQHRYFWVALLPLFTHAQVIKTPTETIDLDSEAAVQQTETLVIEARYWPAGNQDIPANITAIPTDVLTTPALQGIERLSQYISNTTVEVSSVQPRVVMRGQASIDGGLTSPVGYMLDDISLPLGIRQAPSFINTEAVEIIKGPQGSYYGRNSEAGIIKVSSIAPTDALSGWGKYSHIQTDGGNRHAPGHQFEIGITGGTDDLAASLAINYLDADSPYYNQFRRSNNENQQEHFHLQGGLTFYPSDITEVQLRSHWQDRDSGRATMRYLTGPLSTDQFSVNHNTLTDEQKTTAVNSLRIDHDFTNSTLTTITGYTHYTQAFILDADTSPVLLPATYSDLKDRMLSQEFRLAGHTENDNRWAIGSYFYQQDTDMNFKMGFSDLRRITHNDQWGAALFGHIQYPINSSWSITAGLRAEHTQQNGHQTGVGTQVFNQTLSNTEWLPSLIIDYTVSSQQQVYLGWSTGYLPGGFNYTSTSSTDTFSYQAEHTDAFELGHRGNWLSNQLHTELTFFYNQITDKQMIDILPGMAQKISNTAEADIHGLEVSANLTMTSDWSLLTTWGYQKGKISQAHQPMGFTITGNNLPYSPDYTWSLGINYTPDHPFSALLAIRGSDSYFFDSRNTLKQDKYELIDFTAKYDLTPLTVTFAVSNLFEAEIYSRAVTTPAGIIVEDTLPRTFSITANYRW
ncbi:TonB-dependent receptor [Photobacterium nomapromontoriensis]|uniref:TonB-dependent receptor n=1 Tax=Photobacterium nomapromontoriensis TaxID=2910237 RepID=UPI003D1349C2